MEFTKKRHLIRRRNTGTILYSLIFFSYLNVGLAADLDKIAGSIGLQDAVKKTFEFNPALRAFGHSIKAREGLEMQANLPNPMQMKVELEDALGTGGHSLIDNAQATISISWVLQDNIRKRNLEFAQSETGLAHTQLELKKIDAAARTAHLYLSGLAYQARIENADRNVELAEQTRETVASRVKAGRTPEAELARARAELARRKLEREDLAHELATAYRQLSAQWGKTAPDFSRIYGDILRIPVIDSYEHFFDRLNQSPELVSLRADLISKKAAVEYERSKENIRWEFSAGARHFTGTNDQSLVAGVSIPFGKGARNTGAIMAAKENLNRVKIEETVLQVQMETQLFTLYEELQHHLHVIETLRNEIIPPLELALSDTRRAYAIGRYGYLELRSVQFELLEAQNRLIEASLGAHQRIIEIEQLTGLRIAQAANE